MEKKTMNKMMWAAILGGMGVAGYMYMKKNPNAMSNMKEMAKNAAKKTYEKLEDIDQETGQFFIVCSSFLCYSLSNLLVEEFIWK